MRNLVLFFSILLFIRSLHATIINVPTDIDSIQGGINLAADGDTVLVQPGSYVETINFNGKNIVVGGLTLTTGDTSYISQTIISADTSIGGWRRGSVVTIENGEDSTAVLSGFTVTNGRGGAGNSGGGIDCYNSHPTLSYLVISNNKVGGLSPGYGGGIFCNNSSPILVSVVISGNWASRGLYGDGGGGGIYLTNNSNPILANVEIGQNYGGIGGGILCLNSNPILTNVEIEQNNSISGGGIYCDSSSILLNNVIFKEDTAHGHDSYSGYGGGILLANSNAVLNNVLIKENSGDAGGGGIICIDSNLDLFNVTISDNTGYSGGGIYCGYWYDVGYGWNVIDSSNIYLSNVTITNNSAPYGYERGLGGGIYSGSHTRLNFDPINRCNIYNNHADSSGSDLFSITDTIISVIVDTFTVINPDSTHAYPLGDFTFDILNASITNISNNSKILSEFSLKQNYPNPFNPKTTISYQLLMGSKVYLNIYSILGQKVATLVNKKQLAGSYKVEWDASRFASGIYFYSLKTNKGFVQSRKLILLK